MDGMQCTLRVSAAAQAALAQKDGLQVPAWSRQLQEEQGLRAVRLPRPKRVMLGCSLVNPCPLAPPEGAGVREIPGQVQSVSIGGKSNSDKAAVTAPPSRGPAAPLPAPHLLTSEGFTPWT